MLLILRCRRVGPKIYRISYNSTGIADEAEAKHDGEIREGELRRWLKFDSWSLREAAQLSCGQRPNQTNRARTIGRVTKKSAGSPGAVARTADTNELDEMTNLIRRARNVGTLSDPVKPNEFVEWLRAKHPEANLVRIVDEDSRRHNMTPTALPNETLSPNQKAAEANRLRTSHKILLALALSYTKYNDQYNNRSINAIMKAIDDCGLDVGRDAVRKHLSEAYAQNVDEVKKSIAYDRMK
jgi:hypothetical protein